jgi:CRP/FNR family transcriptional regulator, cyclic AMP receptor protein
MPVLRDNRPPHRGADKRAILRDHYLFAKLTPQQIDRLSACVVTKSVKRGTNIFAKGDPGTSLFAIGEGTVRISAPSVEGKDAVFNVLGKGAIFGEIALKIIEILCFRLRRTTEQAEEVMFLDLPSRLAKALMRLLDADTAGMRERKISITQKDLGNIIGMSRESTNKQLRLWEQKRWVRLERNAVVILATDPLAAIAEDGARGV